MSRGAGPRLVAAGGNASPEAVLDFWFGPRDARGLPSAERMQLWFEATPAFDAACRDRLADRVGEALGGGLADWEDDLRRRLALVLLLDQLPRNLFRGSARAFAGDPRALSLASDALERGYDLALAPIERVFLYLPFEHAESPAAQERSVALFRKLLEDVGTDLRATFETHLDEALRHRDVIARFGRFPHRNAALERESTGSERRFLAAARRAGASRPRRRT